MLAFGVEGGAANVAIWLRVLAGPAMTRDRHVKPSAHSNVPLLVVEIVLCRRGWP